MLPVVGVNFRRAGKIYYFDPGDMTLAKGDTVIAETQRGVDMGQVRTEIRELPEEQLALPLRQVVRIATEEDLARREANRVREE